MRPHPPVKQDLSKPMSCSLSRVPVLLRLYRRFRRAGPLSSLAQNASKEEGTGCLSSVCAPPAPTPSSARARTHTPGVADDEWFLASFIPSHQARVHSHTHAHAHTPGVADDEELLASFMQLLDGCNSPWVGRLACTCAGTQSAMNADTSTHLHTPPPQRHKHTHVYTSSWCELWTPGNGPMPLLS